MTTIDYFITDAGQTVEVSADSFWDARRQALSLDNAGVGDIIVDRYVDQELDGTYYTVEDHRLVRH